MKEKKTDQTMSRRTFLNTSTLTAATISIVPRHVLGGPRHKAPSDKLNIAGVGIGGRGAGVIKEITGALPGC